MNTIPRTSGIYKWTCAANGKVYIGSASNLYLRHLAHRSALKNRCHANRYMQASWNKHGEAAFSFEVVELVLQPFMYEREQYYIDKLKSNTRSKGFNMQSAIHNSYGPAPVNINRKKRPPFTEEHKAKIGAANKGRTRGPHTEEQKKMRKRPAPGLKRKSPSPETREKLSRALKAHHEAAEIKRLTG